MSRGRALGVLVADHSPAFRQAVARLIDTDQSFVVLGCAGDGDEAAAMVRTLRPDVVTMDLDMPDADGYSGIARIMAESPTPILVLTEAPTESAAFQALSLGALDILAKTGADTEL